MLQRGSKANKRYSAWMTRELNTQQYLSRGPLAQGRIMGTVLLEHVTIGMTCAAHGVVCCRLEMYAGPYL